MVLSVEDLDIYKNAYIRSIKKAREENKANARVK